MFFVEPLSHTILNGIARGFVSLVCDTGNGLLVDGAPFCLPAALQARMDRVIGRMEKHSSFTRPFRLLTGCDTICSQVHSQVRTLVCCAGDAELLRCMTEIRSACAGNP